jgi:uncharacterized membrane protein
MKASLKIAGLTLVVAVLFVSARLDDRHTDPNASRQVAIEYPAEIKAIIDNKCYGCHSVKGESDDAKEALMWDNLPALTKAKQVAGLDAIIEVLEDGTMPPKDVIEKWPDAKISDAEAKALKAWAEKTADALMNN